MYTVYVLYSPSFKKIYIGYTSDLDDRFASHNERATKGYTIKFRPWVIAYTETHHSKKDAMAREKQLKTAAGRKYIWDIILPKYS